MSQKIRHSRLNSRVETLFLLKHRDFHLFPAPMRWRPGMNVFISYRHKDWGIARQIAEQLRRRVNGYVFFDERSIDQADFERSILSHLRQSQVVVVIITENTFAAERIRQSDDWIRREMKEALYQGKNIVPVRINTLFPPTYQLPLDIQGIARMKSLELHPGHRVLEAG